MDSISDFFSGIGDFVQSAGNDALEYVLQREQLQLEAEQNRNQQHYFQSFFNPDTNSQVYGTGQGNNQILMIGALIVGGALLFKALK